MLPEVAPVIAGLATQEAFVSPRTCLRRLHNVLVKLLVSTSCKEQA